MPDGSHFPIKVSSATYDRIEAEQTRSMAHAVDILASLTFSKSAMAIDGLTTGTAIGVEAVETYVDLPDWNDNHGYVRDEINELVSPAKKKNMVRRFLTRCWKKIQKTFRNQDWFQRAEQFFGSKLGKVLQAARNALLSDAVLTRAIPFYGSVVDILSAGEEAFKALKMQTIIATEE